MTNQLQKDIRRDCVTRANRIRTTRLREEQGYTGKDKLEYEIGKCKSIIINCEWDLRTSELRGNPLIENKLKMAKEMLVIRQEEYKKLSEETKDGV